MYGIFICVDFDGTLVDHAYPDVGAPVPGAIKWCKEFQRHGANIILWTMRSGQHLQDAVDYCRSNDIVLYGINENPSQHEWTNSPKAYGQMYIDDAAVGCPLMGVEGFHRQCVNWEYIGPLVLAKMGIEPENM